MQDLDLLNAEDLDLYSYAGADPVTAIATAAGEIGGAVGSVAQSKATKEAVKLEAERLAQLTCGGKRRKLWSRKRKKAWDDCANEIFNRLQSQKELAQSDTKESTDKLIGAKLKILENKISYKKTALWVGLGVAVLAIGGILIYKKIK